MSQNTVAHSNLVDASSVHTSLLTVPKGPWNLSLIVQSKQHRIREEIAKAITDQDADHNQRTVQRHSDATGDGQREGEHTAQLGA